MSQFNLSVSTFERLFIDDNINKKKKITGIKCSILSTLGIFFYKIISIKLPMILSINGYGTKIESISMYRIFTVFY